MVDALSFSVALSFNREITVKHAGVHGFNDLF